MATNLDNYEKYGSASGGASLKGIVTLEKDEQGIVGLEIPDLLSINNYKADATGTSVIPTNGNLCLRDYTADLLRANNPNIILLTYVQTVTIYGIDHKLYIDSLNLKYAFGKVEGVETLIFIGNMDETTIKPIEIETAPKWDYESVFQLSDNSKIVPLNVIEYMSFSSEQNNNIKVPKTITYFALLMKNYSGTIDYSKCIDLKFDADRPQFTNCTQGTILLNAEQYAALSSEISEGMIFDGGIKVQQVEEEGGES